MTERPEDAAADALDGDASSDPAADSPDPAAVPDDERWLTVNGRRWRRTDPALPSDIVEALKSHLGRGRSGVGTAKRADDADAVAAARVRVGLAKAGLGERGPYWWDAPEQERLARAREALQRLDTIDRCTQSH